MLASLVFLLIQGSVGNFRVDGSSMLPTLQGDQLLLVNKLVYFQIDTERLSRIIPFWEVDEPSRHFLVHPPERGDVIVFRFPRDPSKDFVKRVIGLPGETVAVKDGTVYIDGTPLDEPYLTERDNGSRTSTRLEDKEYFVLGDNRRSSNDSRAWGPLPEANVLGQVWAVYWPFSQVQLVDTASPLTRSLFR